MFATLFNHENPFWQAIAKIADLIWLNILFLVALIPVVTGGAAFTALYETAWKLYQERGSTTSRVFWSSFRTNFTKASLIWLVAGPMTVGVVLWWLLMPLKELLVLKVLLTLVFLLVFPYFFYLPARFENTVGNTLRNAVLIPLARLPYAAGVLLINLLLVAVTVATAMRIPMLLPPLVLGGFGFAAYAAMPLLNRSVAPWTSKSAETTAT